MKLPNPTAAEIPAAKLLNYLLNPGHPDGSEKAAFFAHFGFSGDSVEELRAALLKHATEHDISRMETSPFGTRYVIDGAVLAPDGRQPSIRVVRFVENGSSVPRLVTAYPLKRRNP
jgi:hypothetical protein